MDKIIKSNNISDDVDENKYKKLKINPIFRRSNHCNHCMYSETQGSCSKYIAIYCNIENVFC
jgi:hypothetical protein